MKILKYKVKCDLYDNPNIVDPYYRINLELDDNRKIAFTANLSLGLHSFWINEQQSHTGLTNCDTEVYKFCESFTNSLVNKYNSKTDVWINRCKSTEIMVKKELEKLINDYYRK